MFTTNDIQPIVKRQAIRGWLVRLDDGESVQVDLAELPAAGFPTVHQIRYVAKQKAAGLPGDKVAFAMAIEAAFELAIADWEQSEAVRRHCVHLTGIDYRKAAKIEDSYRDFDNVVGFDEAAKSAAYEIPQLGWNPSESNCDALWAIVREKPAPCPKKSDPAIRQAAIDALASRQRVGRTQPAEVVPF